MKKHFYLFIIIILLSSCFPRSKPSNFYNIISINDYSPNIKEKHNYRIGVDMISIPNYLDRPQVVTIKNNKTELNISELNRWAEPLANSLQRTIVNNLSFYMKNSTIRPVNMNHKAFDFIVTVNINKFDGTFGNSVFLDVYWSVKNKNNKMVTNKHSYFQLPLSNAYNPLSDNYNELVKRESELVDELSIQIAKTLEQL